MAIEAKGKQHNKQIVQRKREKKIMEEIEKELHELREQLRKEQELRKHEREV